MRQLRVRRRAPILLAITCVVAAAAGTASARQPGAKKPITHDVYDSWRSIQGTAVSRDGTWLVYALVPQDGDGELVARNLKTGAEHRHPRGKPPLELTPDAAFVVFTIAPLKAEIDKAKKDKKKPDDQPKGGLGILSLATGQVVTVNRVKSFKLPAEGSTHVAYLMEEQRTEKEKADKEEKPSDPKQKKKDVGTELVVRDLRDHSSASIPEVTEYAWNKDGGWLAYAVSSRTPDSDGAYGRRTSDRTVLTLASGLGHYKAIAFDEAGRQLAFVTDRDDYARDPAPWTLFYWTPPDRSASPVVTHRTQGMPRGYAVSEHGSVAFSKDGTKLFFGTAAVPPPSPADAPEPIKVDIWSWKDPELQSMQKVRAEDEKKRSYLAVLHLKDRRFVQLASTEMPSATVTEGAAVAVGEGNAPYRQLVSWDGRYNDVFVVDLERGSRQKVLEKAYFGAQLSPGGQYVLWYDDGEKAWFSRRTTAGAVPVNLTKTLNVSFEDETWDTPNQPAPYGTAGWIEGDRSVLIYDRFDIWEVKPDGAGARMITHGIGRQQGLVFRYARLDPEERVIQGTKPLLLATTDNRTKATGFYRAGFGGSPPERIVMADKQFDIVAKAKRADVIVLTAQRFDEFPDLWVTDGTFANPKKVSNANPQQAGYRWGQSELIEYVNADGRRLRAILTKPEDFDPSKKYPLMVYIYEELSQGLHRYTAPAPGHSINLTRYVSSGYVLLRPDIVYDTGYPGESAEKCVIPAVNAVVGMGFIDPTRIGIQGHSWGGYQITHLITRTNMFRAVEAGASVSNMVSAYGGIRWGSGMSRAFQYEKSQSRIGAPPWDAPLQFIENSPIFWIEKVSTPYLTVHNDEDDAVPWYQGIEWITAMRRLGKEAYMFTYNGEKHGLRERENQKHFTIHMAEFFDHYLLGVPRPEWMDKGVPFLERGRRKGSIGSETVQ